MSDGPNNDPVRCPDPVHEAAESVKKEYDYPTKGEALRHICREAGYVE
jgi:hypothetical protein